MRWLKETNSDLTTLWSDLCLPFTQYSHYHSLPIHDPNLWPTSGTSGITISKNSVIAAIGEEQAELQLSRGQKELGKISLLPLEEEITASVRNVASQKRHCLCCLALQQKAVVPFSRALQSPKRRTQFRLFRSSPGLSLPHLCCSEGAHLRHAYQLHSISQIPAHLLREVLVYALEVMSSLSPRGSVSGASATAVIEDFADSLKDLTQNNKYEISNLTIIAKESTEHAQAISKTLEAHIKKV